MRNYTAPAWSGTESRHFQHFYAKRNSKEPLCPKPKCNGVLQAYDGLNELICVECGQSFTRSLIEKLSK